MRRVSIFGATGSVGQNTVKIIQANSNQFDINVVTGGKNIEKLAEIAIALNAKHAISSDPDLLEPLKTLLKNTNIHVSVGRQALLQAAADPVDWAMSAVVGFAGVEISLELAKTGCVLALANKESLVCAGVLLQQICRQHNTTLLPVDSEHSAIYQAMSGENTNNIERIILTASGGPFLNTPVDEMRHMTPEQAAAHPNWSMGLRISIDSASMFNKAMELIETKELFDIKSSMLEVIVHPQSIVHSMVGFIDGSIIAQMGPPDMCGAIGYALYWPNRENAGVKRLDFSKLSQLDFHAPDVSRFPALKIAYDVMKMGGISGAVFNGAKEQALDLFLDGSIGFMNMSELVAKTVQSIESFGNKPADDLDAIIQADTWARNQVINFSTAIKTG